jgi:hypothetical protein
MQSRLFGCNKNFADNRTRTVRTNYQICRLLRSVLENCGWISVNAFNLLDTFAILPVRSNLIFASNDRGDAGNELT